MSSRTRPAGPRYWAEIVGSALVFGVLYPVVEWLHATTFAFWASTLKGVVLGACLGLAARPVIAWLRRRSP
ncbi:MAG: hypothetical protein ACYTF8_00140 [Planctomycetota bacterium]|jgi:hypothetical protein